MELKTLPEDVVLKVLETQEDVLTPKMKLVFGERHTEVCPRCGGAFAPWFDEKASRLRHRCVGCEFTRDAETGLVVNLGNPEKTRDVVVRMVTPPAGSGDGRR